MSMVEIAPKYKIGDTVYFRSIEQKRVRQPCPDCLDTRQWKVTTPAGEEFQVDCARCASSYWNGSGIHITSWHPTVRRLTIGSVRTDTAARDGETVSYMCLETGVGSGSVYYEPLLFSSEEDALRAAEALCAEKNSDPVAAKVIDRQKTICAYKIGAAASQIERNARNDLQDELEEIKATVLDEYISDAALVEFLREKWPRES